MQLRCTWPNNQSRVSTISNWFNKKDRQHHPLKQLNLQRRSNTSSQKTLRTAGIFQISRLPYTNTLSNAAKSGKTKKRIKVNATINPEKKQSNSYPTCYPSNPYISHLLQVNWLFEFFHILFSLINYYSRLINCPSFSISIYFWVYHSIFYFTVVCKPPFPPSNSCKLSKSDNYGLNRTITL